MKIEIFCFDPTFCFILIETSCVLSQIILIRKVTTSNLHQTIELHEYLFNLSDSNVMLFSAQCNIKGETVFMKLMIHKE